MYDYGDVAEFGLKHTPGTREGVKAPQVQILPSPPIQEPLG